MIDNQLTFTEFKYIHAVSYQLDKPIPEIADQLFVTEATVRHYFQRPIYTKMGLVGSHNKRIRAIIKHLGIHENSLPDRIKGLTRHQYDTISFFITNLDKQYAEIADLIGVHEKYLSQLIRIVCQVLGIEGANKKLRLIVRLLQPEYTPSTHFELINNYIATQPDIEDMKAVLRDQYEVLAKHEQETPRILHYRLRVGAMKQDYIECTQQYDVVNIEDPTPTELDILRYLAQYPSASNQELAHGIQRSLVNTNAHIQSLYKRYGVEAGRGSCGTARIRLFEKLGWIDTRIGEG